MTARLITRLRRSQIRTTSSFVIWLANRDQINAWLDKFGSNRISAKLLPTLVGPMRVYSSLKEAEVAARPFVQGGHESDDNAAIHLSLADTPRPSDYAVFYHLNSIAPGLSTVLDWGGNCGNVFYSYRLHLDFATDLEWTVYDLPEITKIGAAHAEKSGETRLKFVDEPSFITAPDLFLASGSLHYFPESLADILSHFPTPPKYVLVNRTPMTDGNEFATVQDAGSFWVPCLVRNKDDLLSSMDALGYQCMDHWEAAELSLPIPFRSKESVTNYTGAFFVRQS